MRIFLTLAMVLAMLVPAPAQEDATPWQVAVTGQIQAMRDGDAEAALSFAAESFRTQFAGEAERFFEAIMALGYTPIATSRSHSFGEFSKIGEKSVVQVVKFIGGDQTLYEAVYQLSDEDDDGWHVEGVVLRKSDGVAA